MYCSRKSDVRKRRCEYCVGDNDVHMWVNLAQKCRKSLYVLTADMCIAHVRVMSVSVDVSIAVGNTDVHMGVNLALKCRQLL